MLLANVLKKVRKERKITQSELAKKCGVSQQAVGLWENGRTLPDLRAFLALTETLHVSADYLLTGISHVKEHFSEDDFQFLNKLHALDDRGRGSVLAALNHEYDYIEPRGARAVS